MKGNELVRTVCLTLCLALGAVTASAAEPAAPEPVDINVADAQTLAQVLDGVGVVKAEAIVRYREANGGFKTLEELANVSGIGLATLDRNQGRITLSSP
ncbi:MAG: helix-hairpin-helix domain-containing protein [Pseudomonadales bacterium]|jgi:competence protein ComEA|nr:helix-hairpin-helix domain-containing protein [Pseudomonadales bacterium]